MLIDNKSEIKDELNKIQIEQLHKATLNFSNHSLETKKLCATVEIAMLTLLAGLYEFSPSSITNNSFIVVGILIFIIFVFYSVDVVFYYYQDKLRMVMLNEENEIRKRYDLPEKEQVKKRSRIWRSFVNESQILYLEFALIVFVVAFFMKHK